jgi:small subunit ribosomal protein S6
MAKKTKNADAAVAVEAERKPYELMFILKPDMLENAYQKKLKDFKEFLEGGKAKVSVEDIWGKRPLAYRIKQKDEGIYVVYNFVAPGDFIQEINEHLRIDTEVLRHMIISLPKNYAYSVFKEEPMEEKAVKKEKKPFRRERRIEEQEEKPVKAEPKKTEPKKEEVSEEKRKPDKANLDEKLDKLLEGGDLNM